jgi:hypothetical protein
MQEAKAVALSDEPMLKANSHELRTKIELVRGSNKIPPKPKRSKAQRLARRKQR